jgi:cytochrome bd ubiquinol oxidase subunit II
VNDSAAVALPELVAFVGLAGLAAYAVLAGADFGGGVWDLLAHGPRAGAQRSAIAEAIGPVWEANHVWLIFVIVLLFTAFPAAFAALSIAFFVPFHLVLIGIVLRGAGFIFRAHGARAVEVPSRWGSAFGAASAMTPFLLGSCLGAVSTGRIRIMEGQVLADPFGPWLGPFALVCGALGLAVCAYLAAVYLTLETDGELRADFRRRALLCWLVAGAISVGVLGLAYAEAPRLWEALVTLRAAPVLGSALVLAVLSGISLLWGHYRIARVIAAGQVVLLLAGWALAQWPYLIYPDLTLHDAAAPQATLRALLITLPFGLGLVLPSLWFLFAVFKGRNPAPATAHRVTEDPSRG